MHGGRTGKRRNTKVLVGSAEGKRPLLKQQEFEKMLKWILTHNKLMLTGLV